MSSLNDLDDLSDPKVSLTTGPQIQAPTTTAPQIPAVVSQPTPNSIPPTISPSTRGGKR